MTSTTQLPPTDHAAECATLGSIILDHTVLDEVRDALHSAEDFLNPAHATIYQAMQTVVEKHGRLDMVLLNSQLIDMGTLTQVGGVEYLVELFESVPSAGSAAHYARRVAEVACRRRLIDQHETALKSLYTGAAAGQHIDSLVTRLIEMRPPEDQSEGHVERWLGEALDDDRPRMKTGLRALDDIIGGVEMGSLTIVGARPSMGKAQPLDANVLTEAGFVRMGDLQIGDRLASIDGHESVVTGLFPQGEREVSRITFADGRSTECCDEHLWSVMYRDWKEPRVLTTARIKKMLGHKRYRNRLYIDTFCGDFGINKIMPVDPWLLGFLIGDGSLSSSSIRFSTSCPDAVDRVGRASGSLYRVVRESTYNYRLSMCPSAKQRHSVNPLRSALKGLGLLGKRSYEKSIPAAYMEATRSVRAALLAGLMDSDGWVEKGGTMLYGTTSETLARDVAGLVRSLGGYCQEKTKNPRYTYRGEVRDGRKFYTLSIQIDRPRLYCHCPAKLARIPATNGRTRRLNVVSIEKSRVTQTQCIAVSHPSHLYVTDDYIVTHNTAFAVCAAIGMASQGIPTGFVSAEMKGRRIARRLVCAEARVSTEDFERDKHTEAIQRVQSDIAKWPLWLDETPGASADRVCARLRRWKREHSIHVAFVDYLQLLSGTEESEYERVTNASSKIKAAAGELDIAVVLLAQLNRANTQRVDKRPTMADLRGSGAVEQDADIILMLHRAAYYATGSEVLDGKTRDDEAEIIVTKNRDGAVGTANVGWIGHCGVFASGLPGIRGF